MKKPKDEWITCPDCGLRRRVEWTIRPCVACGTVYVPPTPEPTPEPTPKPKKASRREVQAAVAMMFID
jgi:rubredoxin